MAQEFVVLVDRDDNPIGLEEKTKCHLPGGRLHRAFTALIFDRSGRLLLARRSPGKMLWPGDWDGTVASHPRECESYTASAMRRLPEELGVPCEMDYLFRFEYHVPYRDVGSENEICATLVGTVDASSEFEPVRDEISDVRWVTAHELLSAVRDSPESYCPWMLIALRLLPESGPEALRRHRELGEWTARSSAMR